MLNPAIISNMLVTLKLENVTEKYNSKSFNNKIVCLLSEIEHFDFNFT